MESWEIEQLRRSIVMAPGGTVGPLTKDAARELVEELVTSKKETARYRQIVAELRRVLESLDDA